MILLHPYKDWEKPVFFQGPVFSYFREESKHNKYVHSYEEKDHDVKYMNYNDKPRREDDRRTDREEKFDFKKEKTVGNKFWKEKP